MLINKNLKNLISLFSVEFASRFIAFLSITYLARVLGTSGFGLLNIGLAVLSYAMIISNGGLTILGTKKIASATKFPEKLTGEIFITRLLFSTIIFFISAAATYIFVSAEETVNIILVYLLFLFPSAVLLEWFFNGIQTMEVIAYGRIIGMISYLAFLLLFVTKPDDILLTGVGWTIGGILNSIFLIYIFKKRDYYLNISFKYSQSFKLIKESLPLGLATIIAQFVVMFPVIYLGIVSNNSEVGIFSAAYKLVILLLVLDRIFYALFFPKIVRHYQRDPQSLEQDKIFNRILKLISFIALSVLLFAVSGSEYLIYAIFTTQFSGSVLIFQILLGSFFLTLLNSVFTYTLIAMNKEKAYTFSLITALLFFLISLIPLTMEFGTAGAATALIVFDLVCLFVMYFSIKKRINVKLFRSVVLPIIITCLFIFFLITQSDLAVKLMIALAGLTALAGIMGIKQEVNFIKKIFT